MKVVILVVVLSVLPDTFTIHISTPNMIACQLARKAMPPIVKIQVEGVVRRGNVLRAKCERVQSSYMAENDEETKILMDQIE